MAEVVGALLVTIPSILTISSQAASTVQQKSVSFADDTTPSGPEKDAQPTVDEVTNLFQGLAKKKKSKKTDEKKKAAKTTESADFDAKLAEAGINDKTTDGAVEEEPVEEGDPESGTGIWNHNASKDIGYLQLLSRFYGLMHSHHPDMMSGGSKSYKIPPPQCLREGNKKTIFANIADICKRMKRSDEHVTSYLFAELGTSGSVDGSKRLVIKGRFQQKQLVKFPELIEDNQIKATLIITSFHFRNQCFGIISVCCSPPLDEPRLLMKFNFS